MAKKFGVTDTKATYFTTFYLLLTAITPLLLTPFVNIYGRRPAYVVRDPTLQAIYPPPLLTESRQFFTLVAAMSNIGSAKATSYAGVLISRMFVGVGSSVGLAIGGSTVSFGLSQDLQPTTMGGFVFVADKSFPS
jgi:predicted MFS family arabinose efflux permease